MRSKLLSACIAAGLSLPGHAAATGDPSTPREAMTLRVDGEVVVNNAGTVHSHAIHTTLPDEMHDVVNKAVAGWKFAPSMTPATRSNMRLTLSATPVEGNHVVMVEDVVFRDVAAEAGKSGKTGKRKPEQIKTLVRPRLPGFPVDAVVTVAMRVGLDGRVMDAKSTQ